MSINLHQKSSIQSQNGMNITALSPAKYSPRMITDMRLVFLDQSIQEYGDLSGVVFNKRTKSLICGEQRVKTLKGKKTTIVTAPHVDQHGTLEIGQIEVQSKKGIIFIPFRIVDWDIKKQKAASIAANAHGGKFDNDKLRLVVNELEQNKFNIASLGIDPLLIKELELMGKRLGKKGRGITPVDVDAFKFEHTCPQCQFQFNS
jgi:hypothetical protein